MGVQAFRRRSDGGAARLIGTAALCLLATAMLAGCGKPRPIPVASSADLVDAPSPRSAEPEAARPAIAEPSPPAATDTAGATEQAALPAAPSYDKAEPADPDAVMGLGRGEVEELLGQPGLVRHEAPAEVWQYQSRGCVLDVFMYEATAEYQVVYLEARDGKAVGAATAVCLGAVMDERRSAPTS